MKKLFFITTLLCYSTILCAQNSEDLNWKEKKLMEIFAVYMGIDFSSISGESDSYKGSIPGIVIGFRVNALMITNEIGIKIVANYSQQGGKYEEEGYVEPGQEPVYGGYSGKVKLSYLNTPIVGRYQSKGGFYGELGVQPGFLLSAKDKVDGNTTDLKDYVNKFDFGVVAGGGYEFKNKLGVGLRVVPGLSNINKTQDGYAEVKDHNFVASLRATYRF